MVFNKDGDLVNTKIYMTIENDDDDDDSSCGGDVEPCYSWFRELADALYHVLFIKGRNRYRDYLDIHEIAVNDFDADKDVVNVHAILKTPLSYIDDLQAMYVAHTNTSKKDACKMAYDMWKLSYPYNYSIITRFREKYPDFACIFEEYIAEYNFLTKLDVNETVDFDQLIEIYCG
jgi:hypothetical protein